jgi:hypothetical protein
LAREGLLENVPSLLGVNAPRSLDAQARVDGFSYVQIVQLILPRR